MRLFHVSEERSRPEQGISMGNYIFAANDTEEDAIGRQRQHIIQIGADRDAFDFHPWLLSY